MAIRRTCRRLAGFQHQSPDNPNHSMGPSGIHYMMPQTMDTPQRVNQTMGAPFYTPHRNMNRYTSVWVSLEDMHPVYRVALDKYLVKLPLGRTVPQTSVETVKADFEKVSPLVDNQLAKDLWLAKVIQHCGFKKAGQVAAELWKTYCADRFNSSSVTSSPPVPLVHALLFALCCGEGHADAKSIFEMCLKNGWNLTPGFDTTMWTMLLRYAGKKGDAKLVVTMLEEMVDVQSDVDFIDSVSYVWAFNAIKTASDALGYTFVKKFLFNLSEAKCTKVAKAYTAMRVRNEKEEEEEGTGGGLKITPNDEMYYHIVWHARIRSPQKFSPRQLYFNFKPSTASAQNEGKSSNIKDILKARLDRWKEEGLLPQDYEANMSFTDKTEAYKKKVRSESYKKQGTKMHKDKRLGYTPEA